MATIQQITQILQKPGINDQQAAADLRRIGATPQEISDATGVPVAEINQRLAAVGPSNIEQQIAQFLQTPGLNDEQAAAELRRISATSQQISNATGVPVAEIERRLAAVAPAPEMRVQLTSPEQQIAQYLKTPGLNDQQAFLEFQRTGATAQQISNATGVPVAEINQRLAAAALLPKPENYREIEFRNFLNKPGVTDQQALAEIARLGLTNQQVATIGGTTLADVENRTNALSGNLPFANATQGFTQQFNNYTSIPIGAQYNPNVVGGVGSPYSQIMRQMMPVGNPYATARSGLVMGGYDPGIYARDVQTAADAATAAAAAAAAAGNNIPSGSAGGASGGDGDGSSGDTGSGDTGLYTGGLVTKVFGTDPSGPDDGQTNIQRGEYVIKKSSVKKYGQGLLDKINEGKMPAKKMKSLLG